MRKILIVDDELVNRLLIKHYIDNKKFIFLEAENGLKAVEIVKNENPDLIFMDIMMPFMNGIEATIEIRKLNNNIPIIAISAMPSDELDKIDCFDKKLKKPVNIKLVNDTINEFLK